MPPIYARALETMSFRLGAKGELYWGVTWRFANPPGAANDPWLNQDWNGASGDGTLVYPGTAGRRIGGSTDIPIASLRLKMIRAGMEDYEYLRIAQPYSSLAMTVATQLFPSGSSVRDATKVALISRRADLAKEILCRRSPRSAQCPCSPPSCGSRICGTVQNECGDTVSCGTCPGSGRKCFYQEDGVTYWFYSGMFCEETACVSAPCN
jgi:hypothetical protein